MADRRPYWKQYYRNNREKKLTQIKEARRRNREAGRLPPKRTKMVLTPFENKLRRVLGVGRAKAKRMASELAERRPFPQGTGGQCDH